MILVIAISVVLNLVLAFIDNLVISVWKKRIYHFVSWMNYLAMVAVPYYLYHNLWLIGVLIFIRLLVFNISLSLFRRLKWDYVSKPPKAITDKIALWIFGMRGKVMYGTYLLILVTFILLLIFK